MSEPPTYRFGPRREPGILGLAGPQVVALALGAIGALLALLAGHDPLAGLGCIALGGAAAFVPLGGRAAVCWAAPLLGHLTVRHRARAPLARHVLAPGDGLAPPQPRGEVRWQLPGLDRLVLRQATSGAGAVGVVELGSARRVLAFSLAVTGPRFGLADPDDQGRALAAWGQLLTALATARGQIERVQVTERIVPDDLAAQWHFLDATCAAGDRAAKAIYRAELDRLAGVAVRHEVLLTAVVARPARTRAEEVVATECMRLVGLAATAGLDCTPLGVDGLARVLRDAVDPGGAAALPAGDGELDPASLAPRAWRASWDAVQTDGSLHACYEATGLPRVPVGPEWAWPLVLSDRPVARRTLALHVELDRPDAAIRRAERAVVANESDDALRSRWGFRSGARQAQAMDAALAREAELAGGFADARFALLVAVSATSPAELDASCQALVSQAAQAHVELRRCYGRQVDALVATMPLGCVRLRGGWR